MEWVAPVLEWLRAHAAWTGPLLGLVAFAESLALVGLFVPGAVAMFVAGALVGTGHLDFWPLYAWAVAGAIAGDALSFWIGRHFRGGLRRRWPFTRHPALLERGMAFFAAHGGKGVLLGRFVGPVRPVIPAVAGMLDMPAWRFLIINVLSALAWAPAYLLPGVVFGVSLAVAASVATRLVTLVVAAAVLAWLVWRLPSWLRPVLSRGVTRLSRTRIGRRWWWLMRGLRHATGVLWWTALAVLIVVCAAVAMAPEPAPWEQVLVDIAAVHRTQSSRLVFWLITQLGGTPAVLFAAAVVTVALVAVRRRRAAAAYAGSLAATVAAGYGLKTLFGVARPGSLTGETFGYAFPSGHSFGVTAFFVATAVLVAPPAWQPRGWLLAAAAGLAWLVALTRVALGVHWPLDVIGGFTLGAVGGGLVGLLGPGRCPEWLRRRVLTVATGALLVGAAATAVIGYPERLTRYPVAETRSAVADEAVCALSAGDATGAIWQGQPAPLDQALAAAGWSPAPAWTLASALRWLSPEPHAAALPVLPRVAGGRFPARIWLRAGAHDARTVLYLWWRARGGQAPVWQVAAWHQRLSPRWPVSRLVSEPAAVPAAALTGAGRLCE